jgi:hypothetical protein
MRSVPNSSDCVVIRFSAGASRNGGHRIHRRDWPLTVALRFYLLSQRPHALKRLRQIGNIKIAVLSNQPAIKTNHQEISS